MGGEARPRRYRHIVIDEAQDLTPMQARSLARRCPSGSMTVLGDLAQATGAHPYSDWDQLAELLAGSDGWHLEELRIGYRLPDEVMTFAAALAAKIAPSTTFPTSVRPAGGTSLWLLPTGRSELLHVAVLEAVTLAETEAGSGRSTALILPDVADLLQEVEERIAVAGEGQKGGRRAGALFLPDQGIGIRPCRLVEPAEIVREPAGLRRLYIAITRCTQSLTIVHAEPLPGILTGAADPEEEEPVTAAPIRDIPPVDENKGNDSETTGAFDDFASELENRVRAERECHVHERVRHLLIGELYGARFTPATNLRTIDIASDGLAGTVLYEILGEGGHTYERMREAVLRIMEV
jgi:hypothetical protein